jgi:uncharacterized protein (DUF1330 family)/uncharacterized protein YndB with AHSA1/START domain
MSVVHHLLEVEAPPKAVFELITTTDGLASWWTTAVEGGRAEPGAVFLFRFRGSFNPRLRVADLDVPSRLVWEGVGGHDAWGPSTISFQLDPTRGGTTVRFWHDMRAGTNLNADAVAGANFNWAYYLDSLRLACETGRGKPYRHGDPTARVGATTVPDGPVAYVISAIEGVVDETAVMRYAELAGPAIADFGGQFVVSNGAVMSVEGDSPSRNLSIVEFPSMENAQAWYNSPQNAEARSVTSSAFKGRLLLFVDGDRPQRWGREHPA